MENEIMYSSDEAAQLITIKGWVSSDGFFYNQDENLARYAGCTHKICDCGEKMEKSWLKCKACRLKSRNAVYEEFEFKEWDGETPLVIFDSDDYFFSKEELLDFCDEHGVKANELQICLCRPQHAFEVELDEMYCDILPEDNSFIDHIASQSLIDALRTLNTEISKTRPVSWVESKYRTIVMEG